MLLFCSLVHFKIPDFTTRWQHYAFDSAPFGCHTVQSTFLLLTVTACTFRLELKTKSCTISSTQPISRQRCLVYDSHSRAGHTVKQFHNES